MVFTSLNFLIFFPVVAILFYLSPPKYRWVTLLIASYIFYINIKPVYALLTIGIATSTFVFTRLIDRTKNETRRRNFMVLNIILILLPLLFFKYFSVINNEILSIMERYSFRYPLPEIKLILPVGISYYTFMSIGYTIDVYNEEVQAEKNIGLVALFVSFFPLVLSGPIERAKNLFPQFRSFKPIDYDNVSAGLRMMVWGYFMKLVVADRIGIYVDVVYGNIAGNNGSSILIASILYPFQVYADLGGYSLIAIGVAKIMGIDVIQNFNRPFFATSMAEFWRRWHISLITWLTEYVYTPLSFSFRMHGKWGIIIALYLTFLLAGIWHDANLNFVMWGLFQATILSLEAVSYKKRTLLEAKYDLNRKPMYLFLCMVTTFILFSFSQIFGRADTIADSYMVFSKIVSSSGPPYLDITTLAYSLFGLSILFFKDVKDEFLPGKLQFFHHPNAWIRYSSYLTIIFIIILLGALGSNRFIYFQF